MHLLKTKTPASFNNIGVVSAAITKGLFSTSPKISYLCGIDAHLVFRFGMLFPDFLSDFIVRTVQSKLHQALQLNLKKIQLQSG